MWRPIPLADMEGQERVTLRVSISRAQEDEDDEVLAFADLELMERQAWELFVGTIAAATSPPPPLRLNPDDYYTKATGLAPTDDRKVEGHPLDPLGHDGPYDPRYKPLGVNQ